jgi:hypothetical protein
LSTPVAERHLVKADNLDDIRAARLCVSVKK